MTQATLNNVRYAGMSTCVPRRIISNIDDCPPQLRSSRERLVRNIGIFHRRICLKWQCFSDLAMVAAEKLIVDLNWDKEDIDALIVVSQSPDYLAPATAIILQDRLKLSKTTIAFDVNLGCSGYPYALYVMSCMISSGAVKKGLILVGDKAATVIDPLFSDAGTCTALEFDPTAKPMYFDLNSDGSGYKAIILPVGGHREPVRMHHLIPYKDADGITRRVVDLSLDGPAVLSFSTQQVPPAVKDILALAGRSLDEVDYFVFHQANRMINETIRKKLGLSAEKTPSTLHDFGNTSGASIPLTMTVRLRESLLQGPTSLVLCGFGIGLSWGSCLLDIDGAVFPELIEA